MKKLADMYFHKDHEIVKLLREKKKIHVGIMEDMEGSSSVKVGLFEEDTLNTPVHNRTL